MECLGFEIKWIGFPKTWKTLAKEGYRIMAIKTLYYKMGGNSLAEAKNIVETYMQKNNIDLFGEDNEKPR